MGEVRLRMERADRAGLLPTPPTPPPPPPTPPPTPTPLELMPAREAATGVLGALHRADAVGEGGTAKRETPSGVGGAWDGASMEEEEEEEEVAEAEQARPRVGV